MQLRFVLSVGVALLGFFTLLRAALLAYNRHQLSGAHLSDIVEAFANGARFDLRVVAIAVLPLILALPFRRLLATRRWQINWIMLLVAITGLIGVIELDFYREFNQRLNSLAIQYMQEDAGTVSSMLWHGYPVLRYLLGWALLCGGWYYVIRYGDRRYRSEVTGTDKCSSWSARTVLMLLVLPLIFIAARGTLRQGSPLRWGDAFTTQSPFLNNLGLNGTLTFLDALKAHNSDQRSKVWKSALDETQATSTARELLLQPNDTPYEQDTAAVRRVSHPLAETTLPVRNVVVILMESFAGRYVGALGATENITPHFDKLAADGLLFTRFFSNGTHTHQGMFATVGCFPNVPGFEYLMKTPESSQDFSGLPRLLKRRDFNDVYVYNGDFMWDNQQGFFGNQGMSRFIGRNDYVNPVFSDPTWGVSDQDMFDRALKELAAMPHDKPFFALLQTLSNHLPYALPTDLPVDRVTSSPLFNDHLTAMRYSDWALGQFFDKVRKEPFFNDTLFVVLGDHGFANDINLTDLNLLRFHVPMLMIGPGVQARFGAVNDTVAMQTDVAPTVLGRLGGPSASQCWGRDVLSLPKNDKGFAIIKPSGGERLVAMLKDDRLLVKTHDHASKLYRYEVGAQRHAELLDDPESAQIMGRDIDGFVGAATAALFDRSAGIGTPPSPCDKRRIAVSPALTCGECEVTMRGRDAVA
jgi:phosphoglycerol transferase MdoB-like AlkP superfamily enzyme